MTTPFSLKRCGSFWKKLIPVLVLVQDGQAMVTEGIRLRPGVIVVDVGRPLLNGLDAAPKINAQGEGAKDTLSSGGIFARVNDPL